MLGGSCFARRSVNFDCHQCSFQCLHCNYGESVQPKRAGDIDSAPSTGGVKGKNGCFGGRRFLFSFSHPDRQAQPCPAPVRAERREATAHDCHTLKGNRSEGRSRSIGLMAASFTGCGILGFLREVQVAESLAFAVKCVSDLLQAHPRLVSLGYDDGCHLAEALRRHSDARVRRLDVWIDLFHLAGHVRTKCFIEHNPLTRLLPGDIVHINVHTSSLRRCILSHLDVFGKVQRRRALQCLIPALREPHRAGRSMRLFSVGASSSGQACHILAALPTATLPVLVELRLPSQMVVNVTLTSNKMRARLFAVIDAPSGRTMKKIQINKVQLPCRSVMLSWWRLPLEEHMYVHTVAAELDLVQTLRVATLPVQISFLYGQNTSAAEQNWVALINSVTRCGTWGGASTFSSLTEWQTCGTLPASV